MKTRTFRGVVTALAFAVIASSGNGAFAGVTSTAIGNIGTVNSSIDRVESPYSEVHYRYYRHNHGGYTPPRRGGYNPPRRRYYEPPRYSNECRRVKKRFLDGYGNYYYRWTRVCY